MIRSIVLLELKPDITEEQITELMAGAAAMLQQQRGCRGHTLGRDLGPKDGRKSLAAIVDFDDEAAFRAYDTNEAHKRFRRDALAPLVESSASCQIRVPQRPATG